MAKFYNLADQKLFEKYQFLPQEQYRLGLNLPTDPDPVVDQGIVNTNSFANSGGGGDNIQYNNSFLPDPKMTYMDMAKKYGSDSPQAKQMLEKAGGTYPGGFQSNEGGFEYTNSFPDTSVQMQDLNYKPQGYNKIDDYLDIEGFQDGVGTGSPSTNFKNVPSIMSSPGVTNFNGNLSTIANPEIFNSYGASVKDPQVGDKGFENYSESAFEEEEDKKGFIANMISRAKQAGSNLPGWATSAAKGLGLGSLIGGPVGMALGFLKGGKNYQQFDPRGSFKGGVYTIDGVNYANPGQQNDFYDDNPNSDTYGTNRFDRAKPGSFGSYRTLTGYLNRNKEDKKTTDGGKKTDGGDKKNDTSTTTKNNSSYEDQSYNSGTQASGDGNQGSSNKGSSNKGSSNKGSSSYSSSRGENFGGRFHGADGGRAGYFFGGRVNYKKGGRVSFKNGGLASIL